MQTIQRNKKAHTRLAINGFVIILSFLYIAWVNFDSNVLWKVGLSLILVFVSLIFLFVSVNSLLEGQKTQIALKVDEKGIDDRVSFSEVGFISWEKVEKVFIDKIRGKKHIIIKLKEGVILEPKSNKLKRFGMKDTQQKFGNAIAINKDYVIGKLDDILEIIFQESGLNKIV